jgi:drug/metabolite transporter (DMT)-like permease
LSLVLVAAALHATWNIVAKRTGGGAHFVLLGAIFVLVLYAPAGAWAAWPSVGSWTARTWGLVLGSGLAHLAYFLVLLKGYRAADLTVVYPVARGTGPIVTCVGAVIVLAEPLGARTVAGAGAIAVGVVLVSGGLRSFGTADGARVRAGVAWGLATGLLISVYTVIDGYAVKVAGIEPILLDYFGNVLRLPFLLPAALVDRAGFRATVRDHWRAALFIALVSPLGYVLVLYAARLAPLSHVAPAREVSMLFAALFGGTLLGERDRGLRLVGAACVTCGVILLASA